MTTGLPDLENASLGEELNPLAYDEADYPPIEDMIARIKASDERVVINPSDLSVNGTVIRDEMDIYLKHPAVSSSSVKEALITPLHYWFYINDNDKKKKDHFELGTYAHMAFLEPERFDNVIVGPEVDMTTKAGSQEMVDFWNSITNVLQRDDAKAHVMHEGLDIANTKGKQAYCKYMEDHSKKLVVSSDHAAIIGWLKRHYYTYGGGILEKLFKGAISEVSMYGNDPETGLPVKIRPDAIQIEENIGVNAIISVKTTKARTKGKFEMDCAAYSYHVSEGMYQKVASNITGRNFNCTIMIMLQTVPPYLPAVYWWTPEDLHAGKMRYDHGLMAIKDATEKGIYPGFDAFAESGNMGISELYLPHYIQKEVSPMDLED